MHKTNACFQKKKTIEECNQPPTHSDGRILCKNRFVNVIGFFVFYALNKKKKCKIRTVSCINCFVRFFSRAKSTTLAAKRRNRSPV